MANKNVFSIAQIDRGIVYALQKKFVDSGLDLFPFDYADDAAYNAALQGLSRNIRTFGPGSSINNGQITEGHVYVMRKDISPGNVAYTFPVDFSSFDDSGTTKFQKNKIEDTKTILYEIRYFTNNIEIERLITDCMMLAFPRISYLPGVSPNGSNDGYEFTDFQFAFHQLGPAVDLSGKDYMERLWRFEARSVNVVPDQLIQVVPQIREITIELQPVKTADTEGIDVEDPATFPTSEKIDISTN